MEGWTEMWAEVRPWRAVQERTWMNRRQECEGLVERAVMKEWELPCVERRDAWS